jgi:hypothetical protein
VVDIVEVRQNGLIDYFRLFFVNKAILQEIWGDMGVCALGYFYERSLDFEVKTKMANILKLFLSGLQSFLHIDYETKVFKSFQKTF